jgi:glyoxylase-like metal-dependent hydrolase (beta-lactamase superfamily II)
MKQRLWLLLVCLLALGVNGASAQQDFSKVEIKATHVRGDVDMLTGAGGNIGVSVGPDGILIVDDQFAPLADKIRAALAEIGGGQLKFILNTHFHGDHVGGNKEFGPEATIIAHTNVRKRLTTDQNVLGRDVPASPKEAWPVITFDHSVSIHFNDEEIWALHLPKGHTDGDSIILFKESNVLHMGDDLFAGQFPFVDLGSGGNVEGLIKNIERIISRLPEDVKIIPGHGPLSDADDLKAYHQTLVETTAIIRGKMDAGKSLEEIQAEGLPEKFAAWGGGFISAERWIEIVYRSYSE